MGAVAGLVGAVVSIIDLIIKFIVENNIRCYIKSGDRREPSFHFKFI